MKRPLTIWFPAFLFVCLLIADLPFPNFLPNLTGGEQGLVEMAQTIFLLIALFFATSCFLRLSPDNAVWIKVWFAAGALGCLYVLLEEISYGQHFFNWDTPEYWKRLNDQGETNFHNTSSWLDQKPRLLLEIGIIVGGIIIPVFDRIRSISISVLHKFRPVLPDTSLFLTALLAILPRLYERIIDVAGIDNGNLFVRTSEVQELYFYYFLLLYFLFIKGSVDDKKHA